MESDLNWDALCGFLVKELCNPEASVHLARLAGIIEAAFRYGAVQALTLARQWLANANLALPQPSPKAALVASNLMDLAISQLVAG